MQRLDAASTREDAPAGFVWAHPRPHWLPPRSEHLLRRSGDPGKRGCRGVLCRLCVLWSSSSSLSLLLVLFVLLFVQLLELSPSFCPFCTSLYPGSILSRVNILPCRWYFSPFSSYWRRSGVETPYHQYDTYLEAGFLPVGPQCRFLFYRALLAERSQ